MTSRDFCFWLQGYLELSGGNDSLDSLQLDCIAKHLALVFRHEIDPSMGPQDKQAELNEIHKPAYAVKPHRPDGQQWDYLDHAVSGELLRC